ncbi:hypothetical protein [Paenarthrobacter sp. AB444]|uniref:hypothetical protein n=1 Tax=Paenarthrobacter sp. AB444 TaxID=3025681 RepID=UPI002366E506|nr:hypothetical protein [Paenarthrobacter sp. AB444]MDD7834994.1 hypothetical protein [Paenarthrobacter sp. AB444]
MWGIGQEGWLQLWSGFIGSVTGAIAATLVALLVLRRTNRHQRALAEDAAKKQAELAEKQLSEQRSSLEAQLRQQQEGLNRQLREQRLEARRERERAAMAVIVSGLTGLRAGAKHPDFDHRPHLDRVTEGIHRWRLEIGTSGVLGEELGAWPGFLWLAHDYVRRCRQNHEPYTEGAVKLYISCLDYLLDACLKWSESESDEYGALGNDMITFRNDFGEKTFKLENLRR